MSIALYCTKQTGRACPHSDVADRNQAHARKKPLPLPLPLPLPPVPVPPAPELESPMPPPTVVVVVCSGNGSAGPFEWNVTLVVFKTIPRYTAWGE